MKQVNVILERLKNPSVILSIVAQIVTLLMLFGVNANLNIIMGVITAGCSILTLLGIVSNPSSQKKWYRDDIYICSNCHKKSVHVMVNGKMICSECGAIYVVLGKNK